MNKTFGIRLTQDLKGYYEGVIEIKAKNKKEALKILKSMTKKQIDDKADWDHGDSYDGDIDTIEIDESEINEIT